jgi:hypothetical protein
MRLKPVQKFSDVSLRGRVPGDLHAALTAYTNYYRDTIGQPIELWPLIVQMLERFVETDRDFQMWRRRTQSGPGTGPVTS